MFDVTLAYPAATDPGGGNGTLVLVLLLALVLLLFAWRAAAALGAILKVFMQPLAPLGGVLIWTVVIIVLLLNVLFSGGAAQRVPVHPPPNPTVVTAPSPSAPPIPPVH